ncbi:MAG: MucB/RseB C-terminal domain-containing protein [Gammaproteobacteria bacterium]|nr:MucB/RseB C-terminal domain-containing protein [Gammaproteobacteria bacterium]
MSLVLNRLLPIAFFFGLAGVAGASPDIEALLQRMVYTLHTVNYEGLLLHVQGQGGDSRTMHIFHLFDAQHGERERLISMDGPARELLQEGDRCTCVWPRARLVITGRTPSWRGRLSAERFGETVQLAKFYDFVQNGDARVANLTCNVVRLVPKDAYRHGYRLCIHEPSAMLLRLEVLDGDRRLEMSQFASLRIVPEMGEEVMRLSTDIQGFRVVEEPAEEEPFEPRWIATTLPPGYTLRHAAERRNPHNGKLLEHLIYSDGLGNVSVFIERQAEQRPPEQALSGAMQRITRNIDGFRLTAIGEAPEATIRMILDGLRPVAVP